MASPATKSTLHRPPHLTPSLPPIIYNQSMNILSLIYYFFHCQWHLPPPVAAVSAIWFQSRSLSRPSTHSGPVSLLSIVVRHSGSAIPWKKVKVEEVISWKRQKPQIATITHFGRHRCKNGTHELKCASRFTQFGISWPHRICVRALEK